MPFRLVNTFEGLTAGAAIPQGQNNGSGKRSGNGLDLANRNGTTVVADNAQAMHGTQSAKISWNVINQSGVGWTQLSIASSTVTTAYVRFYFRIESLPSGNTRWVALADNAGLDLLGAVVLRTDGKIDLADTNTTVQATSTSTLATSQWHRIEVKLVSDATTGSMDAKLFLGANAEGSTPDETVSFANQNTNGGGIQWLNVGAVNDVTSFSIWVDSLEMNDTGYPGPFAPPVPSTYETLFANGTYSFTVPATMDDVSDTATYTFGMYFTPSVDGKVYGAAWCNPNALASGEAGVTPQIALYPGPSGGSTALASKTTTITEVRANWNYELFDTPIDVINGTTYMIAVLHTRYSIYSYYFDAGNGGPGSQAQGSLTAEGITGTNNNFFNASATLAKPGSAFHSSWYGIDVLFQSAAAGAQGYWGRPLG